MLAIRLRKVGSRRVKNICSLVESEPIFLWIKSSRKKIGAALLETDVQTDFLVPVYQVSIIDSSDPSQTTGANNRDGRIVRRVSTGRDRMRKSVVGSKEQKVRKRISVPGCRGCPFPYVDIFFYERAERHVRQYLGANRWKTETVFPLVVRPFCNLSLSAPRDVVAHLSEEFDVNDADILDEECVGNGFDRRRERSLTSSWYGDVRRVPCRLLWPQFPFFRSSSGRCRRRDRSWRNIDLTTRRFRVTLSHHNINNNNFVFG